MQQQMASYAGTTITTELIQKYLDENKQLILAILDNQNLGKLNECATYQAKLQQNLMYLAAIADAQPQGPQPSSQAVATNAMPAAQQQYMQQQQMTHQSILGQRSGSAQYMGQGQSAAHQSGQQQQQSLHSQQGMISGGNTGLHIMSGESGMGGNGPPSGSSGFGEYGHGKGGGSREGSMQQGVGMRGAGGGSDMQSLGGHQGGREGGNSGSGHGHGGDDSEASYLKGSDEDGS